MCEKYKHTKILSELEVLPLMFGVLKKIFGTHQSRLLKKYWRLVPEVNAWEVKYQALSDEELKAKIVQCSECKKFICREKQEGMFSKKWIKTDCFDNKKMLCIVCSRKK